MAGILDFLGNLFGGGSSTSDPNLANKLGTQYSPSTFNNPSVFSSSPYLNAESNMSLPDYSMISANLNPADYIMPGDMQFQNFLNQSGGNILTNGALNNPVVPTPPSTFNFSMGANTKIGNAFQSLTDEFEKAKGEVNAYESAHPFNFDDYLAGEATSQAHATLDPYYNQQLGYYLQGVTQKVNRSQTDMRNMLDVLQTSAEDYMNQNQFNLGQQNLAAQEKYGQQGLSSSGNAMQETGANTVGANLDLADYMHKNFGQQRQIQSQTGFDIADILNQSNQQQQSLKQENVTGVSNLANQLATNAQQSNLASLAQLPDVSALSGMGGGFNIMKQLGIQA